MTASSFVFLEQYAVILSETIRNLTVAALAILVVTAPFLINLSVSFLVFFDFVSLIFELFGMMWLLGVSLNSISMINLVMVIGFAVDYSAHVALAFVKAKGSLVDERVLIEAVTHVGASILLGGTSTLIGIFMTAFSKSEIFQIFFKMFFSMVLLGLLHGLCFLPVHLSILYSFASLFHKGHNTQLCDSQVGEAFDLEGAHANPITPQRETLLDNSGMNLSQDVCGDTLDHTPNKQHNGSVLREEEPSEDADAPPVDSFLSTTSNGVEESKEEEETNNDTKM